MKDKYKKKRHWGRTLKIAIKAYFIKLKLIQRLDLLILLTKNLLMKDRSRSWSSLIQNQAINWIHKRDIDEKENNNNNALNSPKKALKPNLANS